MHMETLLLLLARSKHQWMFNGKPCTLKEFADAIWPGEHEDKLVFLLTYSGPETK